jgi:hypothetical protein
MCIRGILGGPSRKKRAQDDRQTAVDVFASDFAGDQAPETKIVADAGCLA